MWCPFANGIVCSYISANVLACCWLHCNFFKIREQANLRGVSLGLCGVLYPMNAW